MHAAHEALRAAQPETAAALEHMKAVAWEATDPALLELCRRRVVALLGGEDDAPEPGADPPSDRDQAFLHFTEQFVFAVASVSDADVEALLTYAEPVDVYRFVSALYTLEMSLRIEMASDVVLAGEGVPT